MPDWLTTREELIAEVERLRDVVQALEEEAAARERDGERLVEMVRSALALTHATTDSDAARAVRNHDALVARLASDAPNPPPNPVERRPRDARGQSGERGTPCPACGHGMSWVVGL